MTARSQILLVDDETNIRRMLAALLREEGFTVAEAPNGNAALLQLEEIDPDVVLLDLLMPPGPDGLETLVSLRERGRSTPVIMMSGKAQLTDAVRAVKLGAFQFLEKPLAPESVLVTVRAALELNRTRAENRALHAELGRRSALVGESAAMQQVRALIARVGPTEARVLLTGESGTGKELAAAAVHAASRRAGRPFVTVNCAAIPRDLVESEMFGHERGAFTGATERRLGRFELAHTGTLFLDEIGDLSADAQAKLLRTLETGDLQRLGAEGTLRVDVRTVAATNRRLEDAVADGEFREDLFFRLNVFPIRLPPLRERLADLNELAQYLLEELAARSGLPVREIDAAAISLLASYNWPGNVRELRNVLERASALTDNVSLTTHDIGSVLPPRHRMPSGARGVSTYADAMAGFERTLIQSALVTVGGKVPAAAKLLCLSRATVYNKMAQLGLVSGTPDARPGRQTMKKTT